MKKPMMPDMLVLNDDGDGEDGAGACQRGAMVSDGGLGLARRVRWAMLVSPKSPRAKVWLDRSERPCGWRWWAMPQIPTCQGLARQVREAPWLAMVGDAPNPCVPRSGSMGQRSIMVGNGGLGLARWVWWAMLVSPKSPHAKVWLDRSEGPCGW